MRSIHYNHDASWWRCMATKNSLYTTETNIRSINYSRRHDYKFQASWRYTIWPILLLSLQGLNLGNHKHHALTQNLIWSLLCMTTGWIWVRWMEAHAHHYPVSWATTVLDLPARRLAVNNEFRLAHAGPRLHTPSKAGLFLVQGTVLPYYFYYTNL